MWKVNLTLKVNPDVILWNSFFMCYQISQSWLDWLQIQKVRRYIISIDLNLKLPDIRSLNDHVTAWIYASSDIPKWNVCKCVVSLTSTWPIVYLILTSKRIPCTSRPYGAQLDLHLFISKSRQIYSHNVGYQCYRLAYMQTLNFHVATLSDFIHFALYFSSVIYFTNISLHCVTTIVMTNFCERFSKLRNFPNVKKFAFSVCWLFIQYLSWLLVDFCFPRCFHNLLSTIPMHQWQNTVGSGCTLLMSDACALTCVSVDTN